MATVLNRTKAMEQPTRRNVAPTASPNNTDNNNSNNSSNDNKDLDALLSKLRPFQLEAYNFATKGKVAGRQWSSQSQSGNNNQSQSQSKFNINNKNKNKPNTQPFQYDPNLVGKGRIMLADEMGLGKTVTSLAIMLHYKQEWPLLILCPASLRYMWPAEIEKFIPTLSPKSIYVVSGFDDADFYDNQAKRKHIQVVIATYSLLQERSASARVLNQFQFKCVIVDESHNLKQKNSQRTKLAMPLLQNADRLVLLSGTPALAKPVELWSQVVSIAPTLFGNYNAFTKRYCNARRGRFGWDVNGLSNEDELHSKLRQVMVRRLKSQVLTELPPKQRSVVKITIPKNKVKECKEMMEELTETRKSIDELVGDEAYGAHFEAKKLLLQAYQASGSAKVSGICDYLLDWLRGSSSQKVLIFAHHKVVMDALEQAVAKELKGQGHIRIDGSVTSQQRAVAVRKFQTCARVRVGILSMTAAGVGLTLTAATTVMFAELHWTPGVLAQAEDRCHRIGQRNAVNVIYFLCPDEEISVDTSLWRMLGRKIHTLGRVVDGLQNASLDVSVQENSGQPRQTQSVQDELQSFFAETSPLQQNEKQQTPVKGTIMSFFKKQTESAAVASSTSITTPLSKPTAVSPTTSSGQSDPTKQYSATSIQSTKSPLFGQPKKMSRKETVSWSCEVCTFDNCNKKPSISGRLLCEMCQTPFTKKQAIVSTSTTPLLKQTNNNEDEDVVVVVASDDEADTLTKSDSPNKAATTPKKSSEPTSVSKSRSISWSCEACTFENNCQKSSKSAWVTCQMCQTPYSGISKSILPVSSTLDKPIATTAEEEQHTVAEGVAESDSVFLLSDKSSGAKTDINVVESPAKVHKEINVVSLNDNPRILPKKRPTQQSTPKSNQEDLPTKKVVLCFTVSKNSERITIHHADTNQSSNVNFDIEQIVSEATADRLLDARANYRQNSTNHIMKTIPIDFLQEEIQKILSSIPNLQSSSTDVDIASEELKLFVKNYLALRGVEKKAIKDSCEPFPAHGLRQAVMKQMGSSISKGSTTRYAGGAKERAQENLDNGIASATDMAILQGTLCAWCGKTFPIVSQLDGVESTYCSIECVESGRLGRGGMFASTNVRSQLFALEGGVCTVCGLNAHAFYTRICSLHPAERLNALCNANWRLPKTPKALQRLLQHPKEGDFWQADHIVAVSLGGGGCELDNFRTLCNPCHQRETEKLRAHLRLTGGVNNAKQTGGGIRSNKRQRTL